MLFFIIGIVIGVVAFISIDLIVRHHNKKKALNSDVDDIENKE